MQEFKNSTIKSVFSRYNFKIDWLDDRIIIQSGDLKKSVVKQYLYFSIITLVLGLVSLFFVSVWIGIGLLVTAVPLYNRSNHLNGQEKENTDKRIEITSEKITINNKFESIEILNSDFDEISVEAERDSKLSFGSLQILTAASEMYELLAIYGEDKRYVHDDAYLIANYLIKVLNNE